MGRLQEGHRQPETGVHHQEEVDMEGGDGAEMTIHTFHVQHIRGRLRHPDGAEGPFHTPGHLQGPHLGDEDHQFGPHHGGGDGAQVIVLAAATAAAEPDREAAQEADLGLVAEGEREAFVTGLVPLLRRQNCRTRPKRTVASSIILRQRIKVDWGWHLRSLLC